MSVSLDAASWYRLGTVGRRHGASTEWAPRRAVEEMFERNRGERQTDLLLVRRIAGRENEDG